MLIIPAIDLQDGCVVRYVQGKLDKKIYSRDPLKAARHWVKQGAKLLHIVDLDGAFSGTPKNLSTVKAIAASVGIPIQFGGGVRTIGLINKLLSLGVWRVVIGTKAIVDRNFLKKTFSKFKDKIIISLDAKDNLLSIKGWKDSFKKTNVCSFAAGLKAIGFKELIYTDVLKDGTLSGPNIKGIKKLLAESGLKIIASGGICSLQDLSRLKKLERQGLSAVIIGKALYEGRFTLRQAQDSVGQVSGGFSF